MKIVETNSEQWEVNESGMVSVAIGAMLTLGGLGALGWVMLHLVSIAWWWGVVAAGIMALGGVIVFTAVNRHMVLRRQGLSEVMTKRIISGKETRLSFDASRIISVNLDTSDTLRTDTGADGNQTTTHERTSVLYVLLNDNSQVMLATSKRSSGGVSINGFNLSGLNKAPLADEAQRIAGFYGVPLSSRADNVSGTEMVAGIANATRQVLSGGALQQQTTGDFIAQPRSQEAAQPQSSATVAPVVTPVAAQPAVPPVSSPLSPVPVSAVPAAPVATPERSSVQIPPR